MLHDPAYNNLITSDIKTARYLHDRSFFEAEVSRLIQEIADRPGPVDPYDHDMGRLFVCMAMLDGFNNHGSTVQLVCDMVNF